MKNPKNKIITLDAKVMADLQLLSAVYGSPNLKTYINFVLTEHVKMFETDIEEIRNNLITNPKNL